MRNERWLHSAERDGATWLPFLVQMGWLHESGASHAGIGRVRLMVGFFRRGSEKVGGRGVSLSASGELDGVPQSAGELLQEVDQLTRRAARIGEADALIRLVGLRHRAGVALVADPPEPAEGPPAAGDLSDPDTSGLPELTAHELTAERVRGAILRNGCAVVRGIIPRDRAKSLGEEVDRLYARYGDLDAPRGDAGADYQLFTPEPGQNVIERPWVRAAGGIWLADVPRLLHTILDLYEQVGVSRMVSDYLGGRPVLSVNKSTLRRAHGGTSTIDWHQDGAFMGDVRTLNVWLCLSDCGVDAPGLLMVPRRIERIVETGSDGARFDWSVSPTVAEAEAGVHGVIHPEFHPGDAVIFDNFFLHATWVDAEMPRPRNAIETWFFSPATFPEKYAPIAV